MTASATTLRLRLRLAPLPDAACVASGRLSVGLQRGRADVERGVARDGGVDFDVEIGVKEAPDGAPDFHGSLVHGKRGERFLYVTWGDGAGGGHAMFRRLKLHLGPLTRAAWTQDGIGWSMIRDGRPVALEVSGREPDGTPACGSAPAPWRLSGVRGR